MAAADVVVGDELYNGGHGAPCYWWNKVRAISRPDASTVELDTGAYLTRKHPAEGVAVRRSETFDLAADDDPQFPSLVQ